MAQETACALRDWPQAASVRRASWIAWSVFASTRVHAVQGRGDRDNGVNHFRAVCCFSAGQAALIVLALRKKGRASVRVRPSASPVDLSGSAD